jgi:toxin-antitoxin system PIN domain toxin
VLIPDVNVLIYAHNRDAAFHVACRGWLEDAVAHDTLGLPDVVWLSFVRIMTHTRILPEPMTTSDAIEAMNRLAAMPTVVPAIPGPRHRQIFEALCRLSGASGDAIPDAYLAALAIEHDATLCTADRDFARFPGLRLLDPRRQQ